MVLISHPAENNISEKRLVEHLHNVSQLSQLKIANQNLNLTLLSKENLERLAVLIGLFHDFGKSTTWFQDYIRGRGKPNLYTHHSLVSSVVGYYAVLEEFGEEWAYMAFQIILKHHSNLSSYEIDGEYFNFSIVQEQLENIKVNSISELSEFYSKFEIDIPSLMNKLNLKDFKDIIENSNDLVFDLSEKSDDKSFEFFFLNNYLFSLLIDFDKKDAARLDNSYFEGNLEEEGNDVFRYIKKCRKDDPEKFSLKIPINKYRNSFLSDIHKNENIKPENHFYSITAPTGIGKTFGCLVFANKLKDQLPNKRVRIVYTLPYTSIIEQNFIEFEKIISFNKKNKYFEKPTRYLLKHHYLSPKIIKNRKRDDYENMSLKDYHDDQLLVESWESAMIVTTFVQFFHTLFGYQNRFLKKFHNIVNAIVILDEVQNIDPDYYLLIRKAFEVLGKVFNMYFLQITATQPNILSREKVIEIINPEKYMKNPLFNRVVLNIDLNSKNLDEFIKIFCESFTDENCLLVMNTRKAAVKFYKRLKECFNGVYKLFCLTTLLTPRDRNKRIEGIRRLLKSKEKIIVVSTQLIEAGVDLSFKNVYRDLGPMDSIVQVAGRCNRNGELGTLRGNLNLINLSNSSIYSKVLIQYTKEILNRENYISSDLVDLVKSYFSRFSFSVYSEMIIKAIKEMNYDKEVNNQIPVSKFSLIPDGPQVSIYLLHTKDAENKMNEFVEAIALLKRIDDKVQKEELLIRIEKLKYQLIEFRISIYPQELEIYKSIIEPQEEFYKNENYSYLYISYENCKNYVYDKDIGFLWEPKKELPNGIFL